MAVGVVECMRLLSGWDRSALERRRIGAVVKTEGWRSMDEAAEINEEIGRAADAEAGYRARLAVRRHCRDTPGLPHPSTAAQSVAYLEKDRQIEPTGLDGCYRLTDWGRTMLEIFERQELERAGRE